jgi:hypothetical protein
LVPVVSLVTACVAATPSPVADEHGAEAVVSPGTLARDFTRTGGWLLSPLLEAPLGATRVGMMLDVPDGTDVTPEIEARGVLAGGGYGAWTRAEVTWSRGPARVLVAELSMLASGAQIRVRESDRSLVAYALWSAVIPEQRPWRDELLDAPEASRLGLDAWLSTAGVRPRSDWGARATQCTTADVAKYRVAVHHTVTPPTSGGSYAARIAQIQAYHMDTNGWCDIGYHFMVTADGTAWEARSVGYLGAHVLDYNEGNAGISLVGCFQPGACDPATYGDVVPAEVMIDRTGTLAGVIAERYGFTIDDTTLKGHRQHAGASTTCPGDNVVSRLGDIRAIAAGTDPGTPPSTGSGQVQGVVWDASVTAGPSDSGNVRLGTAVVTVSPGGVVVEARDSDGYWTFTLAPGAYTLTASAPGYAANTRTVTVADGSAQWASIGLTPADEPGVGQVQGVVWDASVTSGPSDTGNVRLANATITVQPGGQSVTSRAGDAYWTLSLAAGSYTLTASVPGYADSSRDVTVTTGGSEWASLGVYPDDTTTEQPVDLTLFVYDASAGRGMAVAGASVTVTGGGTESTDGSGYAVFSIPTGTATIRVEHDDYDEQILTRTFALAGAVLVEVALARAGGSGGGDVEPVNPPVQYFEQEPKQVARDAGCSAVGAGAFSWLAALLLGRRLRRG